jgi:hypothetical protein
MFINTWFTFCNTTMSVNLCDLQMTSELYIFKFLLLDVDEFIVICMINRTNKIK